MVKRMNKLLKNSIYLSLFTVISLPASYVIRLILSQHLSLSDFGLLYALIGFFSMVQSFNDLGFSETQAYFIPKYIEQKREDKIKAVVKTQLFNQLFTTFLIGLVLAIFAEWFVTTIFHSPNATNLFRLFILAFIGKDFLQNTKMLFFAYQEGKFHGSQEPLRIFLTLFLLIIGVALFKVDILFVVWTWVIVYGVLALLYFILFVIRYKKILQAKHYPMKEIYKEFFPFLVPTLLANNAGVMFSAGTEIFLAYFKGTADVGLYNIAKPISNLALAITTPIANLLKPHVSQIDEQKNYESVEKLISITINAGVFLLLPFSITLAFYAKESIVFLFGSKYVAATQALQFISFEIVLNILSLFIFGIIFGLGLQKSRAKIIYLSSAISLVFSLILIPRFASVGVALANLGYALTAVIGGLYIIRQKIPFSFPLSNYLKMLILSMILIFSQVLLKFISPLELSQQLLLFILKAAVGLSLYYGIGIFIFKIVDIRFVTKLIFPSIPARVQILIAALKGKQQVF
ncbi:MAG: hypothetical protein BroJett025_04850 [Patescibacteria group bacterium]|nr:MAG: hypothetical protein BroJett025_04850 [Patescibacteria group bacterium]